jgi:hypothetical protein
MCVISSLCCRFQNSISDTGISCIQDSLYILTQIVESSFDMKEQFIQIHGFHMLSHAFMQLSGNIRMLVIDFRIVDVFFTMLNALGVDSRKDDGLHSFLQGVVFHPDLWRDTSLATRLHHLLNLVAIGSSVKEDLHRAIGVQRMLDFMSLSMLTGHDEEILEGPQVGAGTGGGAGSVAGVPEQTLRHSAASDTGALSSGYSWDTDSTSSSSSVIAQRSSGRST